MLQDPSTLDSANGSYPEIRWFTENTIGSIAYEEQLQVKRIILLIFTLVLSGCWATEAIVPPKKTKRKRIPTTSTEGEAAELDETRKVVDSLLVRRLKIDVLGTIPTVNEINDFTSQSLTLQEYINSLLSDQRSSLTLANRHRQFWNLDGNLPELNTLGQSNTVLQGQLTTSAKEEIAMEPILRLRHALDANLPFKSIFEGSWSIIGSSSQTILGDSGTEKPWGGESYVFSEYANTRPKLGILTNFGLLAAIDNEQDSSQRRRAAEILKRFTCEDRFSSTAHLFYEMEEADFTNGMRVSSTTKDACRSCHTSSEGLATALQGVAVGSTLTSWLAYSAPSAKSITFNGTIYDSHTDFAEEFSNTSKLLTCEIKNLMESFLQRPLATSADRKVFGRAFKAFLTNNQNIKAAVKIILSTDAYAYDSFSSQKGKTGKTETGLRLLSRQQWISIFDEIIPNAASISFPSNLQPSAEEFIPHATAQPSGSYYLALKEISRKLANEIVKAELTENSSRSFRRLLTALGDGNGYATDTKIVHPQIMGLWQSLTSRTIKEDSATFTLLKALWTAGIAVGADNAEKSKNAWRLVINGILMSQEFFTY